MTEITPISAKDIGITPDQLSYAEGIQKLRSDFLENAKKAGQMDVDLHFAHILKLDEAQEFDHDPNLKQRLVKAARDPLYLKEVFVKADDAVQVLDNPDFGANVQKSALQQLQDLKRVVEICEINRSPQFSKDELNPEAQRIVLQTWQDYFPIIKEHFEKYLTETQSIADAPSQRGRTRLQPTRYDDHELSLPQKVQEQLDTLDPKDTTATLTLLDQINQLGLTDSPEVVNKFNSLKIEDLIPLGEIIRERTLNTSSLEEIKQLTKTAELLRANPDYLKKLNNWIEQEELLKLSLNELQEKSAQLTKENLEFLYKRDPYTLWLLIDEGSLSPEQISNLTLPSREEFPDEIMADDFARIAVTDIHQIYKDLQDLYQQYSNKSFLKEENFDLFALENHVMKLMENPKLVFNLRKGLNLLQRDDSKNKENIDKKLGEIIFRFGTARSYVNAYVERQKEQQKPADPVETRIKNIETHLNLAEGPDWNGIITEAEELEALSVHNTVPTEIYYKIQEYLNRNEKSEGDLLDTFERMFISRAYNHDFNTIAKTLAAAHSMGIYFDEPKYAPYFHNIDRDGKFSQEVIDQLYRALKDSDIERAEVLGYIADYLRRENHPIPNFSEKYKEAWDEIGNTYRTQHQQTTPEDLQDKLPTAPKPEEEKEFTEEAQQGVFQGLDSFIKKHNLTLKQAEKILDLASKEDLSLEEARKEVLEEGKQQ